MTRDSGGRLDCTERMTGLRSGTQYIYLVHTRLSRGYYGDTSFVPDHRVSAPAPLRETPEGSHFRRAAVLRCEECGESFLVGYVARSEVKRRIRADDGFFWKCYLVVFIIFAALMGVHGGLSGLDEEGEITGFLIVWGILGFWPVVSLSLHMREMKRGIIRLVDSGEPPPKWRHDWIRTRKRDMGSAQTSDPTPE